MGVNAPLSLRATADEDVDKDDDEDEDDDENDQKETENGTKRKPKKIQKETVPWICGQNLWPGPVAWT